MSGNAQCYCCPESGGAPRPPLDCALDELGMLATVPHSRRQHQAESRRRRRYTVSAVQRRSEPAAPASSAQIAEQMSRIRLDGGGGASAAERTAFETLYINWDYVSSVGVGPLGSAENRPAGGKTRRAWAARAAKPYEPERPAGGRARTTSWSQQPAPGGEPAPRGAENRQQAAPGEPAAAPALGRSLSMENLKLGESAAAAAAPGPDVETISRKIEDLRVEFH